MESVAHLTCALVCFHDFWHKLSAALTLYVARHGAKDYKLHDK